MKMLLGSCLGFSNPKGIIKAYNALEQVLSYLPPQRELYPPIPMAKTGTEPFSTFS